MLMMSKSNSFFHCGQFKGSRGDSEGCGTRTMSELRPLACLRLEVSRPLQRLGKKPGKRRKEHTMILVPRTHHISQQGSARHMLQVFVFKNPKTHLHSSLHNQWHRR